MKKFFATLKVGEKGQIVIPKEVREMFDIKPGGTVIILADVVRGIAILPSSRFDEITGKIMGSPEGGEN